MRLARIYADDAEEMLLAERLVGEARQRRARKMNQRERVVTGVSACAYLAVAVAIAVFVPDERHVSPAVVLGLLVGYALILQVRFEFGGYYASPEQLAFVPLLLIAPLPYVPLLFAAAGVLAAVPDIARNSWHRQRWLDTFSDSWAALGGVIVLVALAPGDLDSAYFAIYLAAFAAHFLTDVSWTLLRNRLLDRLPLTEVLRGFAGTARVDAILTPLAFVVSLASIGQPLYLLAIAPVVWLLHLFSQDRRERYSKTLELHRAYRGTVMLLSDVIESEDTYTAQHSRSVVDLVNEVADELGVPDDARQELEFAAMLHDVGKIAIPKEILNKPAALTDMEFEVMKTHTIEGQFMLDRVGGLLGRVGEIVRSCHERWDGTGYPDGLKGEEIPYAARIVFCCDAYNAMTSDRVYRGAMPPDEAIAELELNSGTQFDPRMVAAVTKVVSERRVVASTSEGVRAVLAGAPLPREISASTAS
jgi:HD-GYP domain-containing protein (c-di-GMP phosphodiesterase class II)